MWPSAPQTYLDRELKGGFLASNADSDCMQRLYAVTPLAEWRAQVVPIDCLISQCLRPMHSDWRLTLASMLKVRVADVMHR